MFNVRRESLLHYLLKPKLPLFIRYVIIEVVYNILNNLGVVEIRRLLEIIITIKLVLQILETTKELRVPDFL
jgi:hypothetical protein